MPIEKVAVIGAGVMGCDVALNLSCFHYRVFLKDISHELLQNAKKRIKNNFKMVKMMRRDSHSLSIEEILSRIAFVTEYKNFEEIDIVIENITENYREKEQLYKELLDVCRADVLFGVNTSCIPITQIAAHMPKPENVIGLHFLNPVPLKKLVEVIISSYTSEEILTKTKNFLKSLEKIWVVVKDSPGFVTNRILMLTINEAILVIQENIAAPKDVDKIFKLGFSHKMGPLATADLIGLDTIHNSLMVLYKQFNDPKYKPCPLLTKMVDAGLLGQKSGKGFFDYSLS